MSLELAIYGASDIGSVRDDNEDAFAIGDLDRASLWDGTDEQVTSGPRAAILVVCDGMGGAQGGEVASDIAARAVWEEMRDSQTTQEVPVFARLLRRAVRAANRRVFEHAKNEPSLRGMGTTLSAVGFAGAHAVIAQVGDSRVYVHRAGCLVQVTRDQSLLSALVQAGRISQTEPRPHVGASAILQALGVGEDVDPGLSVVDLRRGDRVLLCSDGLHGLVADGGIATILSARPTPRDAALSLIAAAKAAGGADNVTAIVCDVDGDDLVEPASEDDLPRYTELDPHEEGERAISTTSHVARRLAARIGIGDDPGPPVVPATGQHAIVRPPRGLDPRRDIADVHGPAHRELRGARIPLAVWLVLLAVAAIAGWIAAGRW